MSDFTGEQNLSEYEGNHYVGTIKDGKFTVDTNMQKQYADGRVLPENAYLATVVNGKFQLDNRLYTVGEEQILQTVVGDGVEKQKVPYVFVADDLEFTGKVRLGYTNKSPINSNLEVIALKVKDGDSTFVGYDMVIQPADPMSLITTNESGETVVDYTKAEDSVLIENDGKILYGKISDSVGDQIQLYTQKTGKISFADNMFLWDGEPIGEDSIEELIFHDKNDYITLSSIDIQEDRYKDYNVGDVVPKNGWNVEITNGDLDYFFESPNIFENPEDSAAGVWRFSLLHKWHYLANDRDGDGNRLIFKEDTGWLTEVKRESDGADFLYSHNDDSWTYYDLTPEGTAKVWEATEDGKWEVKEASTSTNDNASSDASNDASSDASSVNTEGWFSQQVADGTYTVYDPDGNIYSTGNLTEEEAEYEINVGAMSGNQEKATKTVTPVGDGDNTGETDNTDGTGDAGDLTETTEEITDMQGVLDQYIEDLASGMSESEAQIKRDDAILAILQSEGVNPEDGEQTPYRPWNPISNTAGQTITDQSAATATAVSNALSFAQDNMSLGMKGLSSAWDATLGKLGVNNPFKWLQKNTAAYRALEERINSAVNANTLAKIQAKETNLGNTLYELQLDGYPIINPEGDIYDQTFYMIQKPYLQAPDGSYLIGEDGKPLVNPDYREDLSIYYTKVGPDGIGGTSDDITSAFSKSNILPFQFKRQEGELMDDIGSKLDAVIENSVKPTKFFDAQGNEVDAGTEGAIGLSRDDQIFNQQMQALKDKNLIKGTAGADGIFGTADDTLDDAGPDGILGTEDDPKSILEQLSDDITTYEYGDINTAGSRDRLQSDYKNERRRLVDRRNALEELGTFENMSRKADAYNALGQAGQNVIDTRNNNFKRLAKQKLFGGSISMDDLKESSTQRPQASDQPLSFNLFGNDFQFGSGSSLDPLAVVNKLGNYREGQELDYDLEDVKQSIMSKIADNNSFSKNFNYKIGEKIPTGAGG